MSIVRIVSWSTGLAISVAAVSLAGCEKKAAPSNPPPPASGATQDGKPVGTAKTGDDHGHDHGDGHDHGATTDLGEQTAGGLVVWASRDGEVKAGGEASIDAKISGGTAKVIAVRFWIGTEDAKGSVKAKAELEHESWHSHVEAPSPLPAGAKLWIEVEAEGGAKTTLGFDLKA